MSISSPVVKSDANTWKILNVGACDTLHKATHIVLKKISFVGKPFEVKTSQNLAEAKSMLQIHQDIAIILLDMVKVKKGDSFGKELLHYIRKDLQNDRVRIILITGYPNSLPEKEIINNYEIDACIAKEMISNEKIEFAILSVIQTYYHIYTVTKYMQGLAGSIAHEFRTPLSIFNNNFLAIKNTINDYKDKLTTNDYALLENVVQSGIDVCRRTDQIINMTLKNIHNHKVDVSSFRHISVAETIHTALNNYIFKKASNRDKIETDFSYGFEFLGDETLFIFVIYNLLKNSLYYLHERLDSKISIWTEKQEKNNVVFFRDNGPGIPSDKLPYIFDPFFTSGKENGTGLGLVFCKRVMQTFEGTIDCESVEGEGVTFILTFPYI